MSVEISQKQGFNGILIDDHTNDVCTKQLSSVINVLKDVMNKAVQAWSSMFKRGLNSSSSIGHQCLKDVEQQAVQARSSMFKDVLNKASSSWSSMLKMLEQAGLRSSSLTSDHKGSELKIDDTE
ncbi:hypothetical protein Tco_0317318 [Tanacetum coccineum]